MQTAQCHSFRSPAVVHAPLTCVQHANSFVYFFLREKSIYITILCNEDVMSHKLIGLGLGLCLSPIDKNKYSYISHSVRHI